MVEEVAAQAAQAAAVTHVHMHANKHTHTYTPAFQFGPIDGNIRKLRYGHDDQTRDEKAMKSFKVIFIPTPPIQGII